MHAADRAATGFVVAAVGYAWWGVLFLGFDLVGSLLTLGAGLALLAAAAGARATHDESGRGILAVGLTGAALLQLHFLGMLGDGGIGALAAGLTAGAPVLAAAAALAWGWLGARAGRVASVGIRAAAGLTAAGALAWVIGDAATGFSEWMPGNVAVAVGYALVAASLPLAPATRKEPASPQAAAGESEAIAGGSPETPPREEPPLAP